LLHLAERFGDELEGGEVTIPLPLRRSELAHLVGATVETTIRVIRKWERDGLLVTTRTGFVLRDLEPFRSVTRGA
jgi:CRP-like cAMP-binding protein